MASLALKSTSPYFFACFRDHAGRQCRRSTHETDRRRAQKVADAYEGIARRKINAKKIRRTMIELCREIGGQELASTTLKEYCARFLAEKKREVKAGSYELYEKAVRKLVVYLAERGDEDIADISKADIINWRDSNATRVSTTTANNDLRIAKMLFKNARRDSLVDCDPCEFVSVLKREANALERRPFTLEEIRRLLEICDPEWRSLVLFGLYTGQRLGDIASLTWSSIDTVRDELHFLTKKTGKRLTIPLSPALRDHILEMATPEAPDSPVHPRAHATLQRDKRVRELSSQFGDLLAAAGLREKLSHSAKGNGRDGRREALQLSYHCLRHSAVSMLRDAGVAEAIVMELVGHDSVAISRHYSHVGHAAKREAVQALPRL